MSREQFVFLGAGASHGRTLPLDGVDPTRRPPVVAELFDERYSSACDSYPLVREVAAMSQPIIARGAVALEDFLRESYRDSPHEHEHEHEHERDWPGAALPPLDLDGLALPPRRGRPRRPATPSNPPRIPGTSHGEPLRVHRCATLRGPAFVASRRTLTLAARPAETPENRPSPAPFATATEPRRRDLIIRSGAMSAEMPNSDCAFLQGLPDRRSRRGDSNPGPHHYEY
jgi:hypothetical protein